MAEADLGEFLDEMAVRATQKQIMSRDLRLFYFLSEAEFLDPVGDDKLMVIVEAHRLAALSVQAMSLRQHLTLERLSVAVEKRRDSLHARAVRGRRKEILRRRRPIKKAVRLYSPSNPIVSAFRDARGAKAIRNKLDYVASQHNQWVNMSRMPLDTVSQTQAQCVETGPLICEEVIGRDQDMERLVRSLFGSSIDQFFQLAIVGLGGIGKNRVLYHFNVTIWPVLHPLNKKSQMAWRWYWPHSVTSRKKFFLVIDIWDHMDHMNVIWQEMKQQLGCGVAGSMVSATFHGLNPLGPCQEDHDVDDDDDDYACLQKMRPTSQLAGKVCLPHIQMLRHCCSLVEQKLNGRFAGMSWKQEILIRILNSPDSFQKCKSMDEREEDYRDSNNDQLKQLAVTKYLTTQTPIPTRDFRVDTRKTKKKDKVEETDYDNQSSHFVMSFSLVTSCLMLCLLPLISDEEVMSGTFLVLELRNTVILSVSLSLAATTSLLSLETMPQRPKFAHSCGFFAILSLFFALAVLLSSFLLHSI
uniref:NB-ARC domain-containing protein n=1 Tax=Opuntia streptacantha TaxID=393608 RepID=A0A7C9ETG4_OPUST